MSILLLILKIIGITLLVILGLVLLLVLLVLFAPFRYRMEAEKHEKLIAKVRVRWVFPLAQVLLLYEDGISITARVFGIPVFRKKAGGGEKEPEEEEESGGGAEASKAEADAGTDEADVTPKPSEQTEEKNVAEASETDSGEAALTASVTEETGTGETAESKEKKTDIESEPAPSDDRYAVDKNGDLIHPEVLEEITDSEPAEPETPAGPAELTESEEPPKKEKFGKLKRLKAKLETYKEAAAALWKLLTAKKEILVKYLTKERTKRVGKLLWKYLKKIVLHILPRKLSGNVIFGSGDPELTGKISAGAAMLYILYGNYLQFEPDFEEKRVEGDVLVSGRIRLGVLAWYALRVWFNKDFKKSKAEAFRVKDKMAASVGEAKEIIRNVA